VFYVKLYVHSLVDKLKRPGIFLENDSGKIFQIKCEKAKENYIKST